VVIGHRLGDALLDQGFRMGLLDINPLAGLLAEVGFLELDEHGDGSRG
jgi:hypothetical protein